MDWWIDLAARQQARLLKPRTCTRCCAQRLPLRDRTSGFDSHASVGCESPFGHSAVTWRRFDPHAHAGRDPAQRAGRDVGRVSTHTPARGMTTSAAPAPCAGDGFNSHARTRRYARGLDDPDGLLLVSTHTPSRGATPARRSSAAANRSFNPHAHTGRDLPVAEDDPLTTVVSTHTPTRGVTGKAWPGLRVALVSTHTSTRGVTGQRSAPRTARDVSTHTSTRGVTCSAAATAWAAPAFQPTRPHGA